MATYQILVEQPRGSGQFVPAQLPDFVGSEADANAYVEMLQVNDPTETSYAAQQIAP